LAVTPAVLCCAVAVDCLHYENPASGCGADEKVAHPGPNQTSVGICAPDCEGVFKNKCPEDPPTATAASFIIFYRDTQEDLPEALV
jgi:hypothetical protein